MTHALSPARKWKVSYGESHRQRKWHSGILASHRPSIQAPLFPCVLAATAAAWRRPHRPVINSLILSERRGSRFMTHALSPARKWKVSYGESHRQRKWHSGILASHRPSIQAPLFPCVLAATAAAWRRPHRPVINSLILSERRGSRFMTHALSPARKWKVSYGENHRQRKGKTRISNVTQQANVD